MKLKIIKILVLFIIAYMLNSYLFDQFGASNILIDVKSGYSYLGDLFLASGLTFNGFLNLIFGIILFFVIVIFYLKYPEKNMYLLSMITFLMGSYLSIQGRMVAIYVAMRSHYKDKLSELDPANLFLQVFNEIRVKYSELDYRVYLRSLLEERGLDLVVKEEERRKLLDRVGSMSELRERVKLYKEVELQAQDLSFLGSLYENLTSVTSIKICVGLGILIGGAILSFMIYKGLGAAGGSLGDTRLVLDTSLDNMTSKVAEKIMEEKTKATTKVLMSDGIDLASRGLAKKMGEKMGEKMATEGQELGTAAVITTSALIQKVAREGLPKFFVDYTRQNKEVLKEITENLLLGNKVTKDTRMKLNETNFRLDGLQLDVNKANEGVDLLNSIIDITISSFTKRDIEYVSKEMTEDQKQAVIAEICLKVFG